METLDVFLDAIDVALILQGRQSEIVYANRAALELLGRKREDVVGLTSFDPGWDVIRPDGRAFEVDERPVAIVLRTGRPVSDVVLGILHPKTKSREWMLVDAKPLFDGSGELTHVAITLHRITDEQHRVSVLQQVAADAKRELADRELLYSAVVGVMGEGVIVRDEEGRIQTANPAAARILGVELEELLGDAPIDPRSMAIGPDGEAMPREHVPSEITRTTGQPVRGSVTGWRRADGSEVFLRANADPLRATDEDAIRGVVVTFADVTDERQAKLALVRSRAELAQVTEAIPGVLFRFLRTRVGADRFTFLSARTRDLFGVDVDAALGEAALLLDRVHLPDRHRFLMETSIGREEPWEGELEVLTPGGLRRWLRGRALPEAHPEGVLWSGVLVDVTDERQLRQQLDHAQRREAMGDLAAGVAHNFNNMLAAIIPNLESAHRDASPELQAQLEDALVAARQGADLVRELMQMTRLETTDTTEPVDVVGLVRYVVNVCRPAFEQRVAIRTTLSVERAVVEARRSELSQVFLNMCLNARDAMADSADAELWLDVSLSADERWVVVRIQDVGVGMSAETVRRLGEPFFTTKAPGKGTGLGLATGYATVQALGGLVHVESRLGVGTTFEIRLPHAGALQLPLTVPPLSEVCFDDGRVLLVDDERMIRRAVGRDLKQRGLEVLEASDGVEALRVLKADDGIDALVIDLTMPNMTGERLLASVRQTHPRLPVIVVTGHLPDDCDLAGASAVLLKPLSSGALAHALRQAWFRAS